MKKNNKGFTLIELLAIIVILAIIAVITVPIILNIIENSRRGAASDSAYGYKDSVNKTYIAELSKPNLGGLKLNGTYEVQDDGTLKAADTYDFGVSGYEKLPVAVSGDKPSSGSLTYENNVLKSGWLVIGDYKVEFKTDGTVTTTRNTSSSVAVDDNDEKDENDENESQGEKSYTYYGYGLISENPTGYDFDYESYEAPSNNNECPEYYAYYAGDDEHNAGCYYVWGGYCDEGLYNEETGKCEYEGYSYATNIHNDWEVFTRNDGTTLEVCRVFPNGTVCMTSTYYNSDYSSDGNYSNDFENCDHDSESFEYYITSNNINNSCLKGYVKSKAEEILSKGLPYCELGVDELFCGDDYLNQPNSHSNIVSCSIYKNGYASCTDGNNSYGISSDGSKDF